jgi:hypothetical protein
MIIPVFSGVFLMFFILSKRSGHGHFRKYSIFIMLFVWVFIAFIFIPIAQNILGASSFDLAQQFNRIFSADNNIAPNIDGWSDRSIGFFLLPDNALQALLFLPLRMILNLITPLPNITVTFSGLLSGSYGVWQNLMTVQISLLMILLFSYVLTGTSLAWNVRK